MNMKVNQFEMFALPEMCKGLRGKGLTNFFVKRRGGQVALHFEQNKKPKYTVRKGVTGVTYVTKGVYQ